jgi:uncharacterized protein
LSLETQYQRCWAGLNALLDSLSTPIVRDLAWVIGAPELLWPTEALPTLEPIAHEQALRDAAQWLKALDGAPHPLIEALSHRRDGRLGAYVERLIEFWLAQHPDVEQLIIGLQVQDNSRTLGAFDLLMKRRTLDVWEHWELTIKFYLCVDGQVAWSGWLGPHGRDRLDKKLTHMSDHQLTLSLRPEARARLSLAGLSTEQRIIPRAWVKGVLFDHWRPESDRARRTDHVKTDLTALATAPTGGAPARGVWLRRATLERYIDELSKEEPQFLWRRCDKPHWLAPQHGSWRGALNLSDSNAIIGDGDEPRSDEPLLSSQDLLASFDRDSRSAPWGRAPAQVNTSSVERAVMYSCQRSSTIRQEGPVEHHRLFIVPNNWGR